MRRVSRLAFGLLLTFGLTLSLAASAQTQGVNDFVITDFTATYSLTNEDPQGLLTVTEQIELDFSGQNQGILRALPQTYQENDLNLRVISVERDGEIEPYITYAENDNTVIRIGEAGTFITGEHTYVLNYQVENVITFYDGYDEFFWDINGDQWLQLFERVGVTHSTSASRDGTRSPQCYTGAFGSTKQNCSVVQESYGLEVETTQSLGPGETLTIIQAYEPGYFTPQSWFERNREFVIAGVVLAVQLLAVRAAHVRWRRYGKDPKKRGVVAPYFERPKDVSVMQASYVAENRLTPKHISASMVDLATRGYVQIIERKDGRKTKHDLVLQKAGGDGLTEDEKILIDSLFSSQKVGSKVELESKKNKLHKTVQKLGKLIDQKTHEKGFYELPPRQAGKKFIRPIVYAVLAMILGFILAGATNGISAVTGIVAFVIVLGYLAFMTKRSMKGNMLVEHMQGLRLYMDKAEKDRIALQDAVAAPLAPRSGQPERSVKFFEKLLPFAVALGVEKTWANAFKDIYQEPPDWYNGNWNRFTTAALVSSLGETATVTSQSFSAPSSSGSSGFSGGSFSGGGGGGGGGGGW